MKSIQFGLTMMFITLFNVLTAQVMQISGVGIEEITHQQTIDDGAIVGGFFDNTLVVGNTTLKSRGGNDAFLMQVDADMKVRWIKQMGGTKDDNLGALAIIPNGSIYTAINFGGKIHFNDFSLEAQGNKNSAIFLLTPTGEIDDVYPLPGRGNYSTVALGVADGSYLFQAIQYDNVVQLEGATLRNAEDGRPAVALLTSTDKGSWKKVAAFHGVSTENPILLQTEANDDMYMAFNFDEKLSFASESLVADGNSDFIVLQYATNGALNWYERSWGAGYDRVDGLTVDADGNVYVTGYYSQQIRLEEIEKASAAGRDLFVAKLDEQGHVKWLRTGSGGLGFDAGFGITTIDEEIVVTGKYADGITFGTVSLAGASQTELFVATYKNNGLLEGVKRGGGSGMDSGEAVSVVDDKYLMVTGLFSGITNVGGTMLKSGDGQDAFIWKLTYQ